VYLSHILHPFSEAFNKISQSKHDFYPNLAFFFFLLDKAGMLRSWGLKNMQKSELAINDLLQTSHIYLFYFVSLIFFNLSHHFTPCSIERHKKERDESF
jgi:hypothetical protein